MVPYLVSYLRKFAGSDVGYSIAIWLSCGLHSIQGISTPLTSLLIPKFGYKPLLAVGCLIHK